MSGVTQRAWPCSHARRLACSAQLAYPDTMRAVLIRLSSVAPASVFAAALAVIVGVAGCSGGPTSRSEAAMRRAEREQASPPPVYTTEGAFEPRLGVGSLHKASGLVCPASIAGVPLAVTGTRRSPDGGETARCQYTARAIQATFEIEIEATPMQRTPVDFDTLATRTRARVQGRAARDASISGAIGAVGQIWPSGIDTGQAHGLWAFRWNAWRVGVSASFPESQVDTVQADIVRLLDTVQRTSQRR